jgi:hypothetical protein
VLYPLFNKLAAALTLTEFPFNYRVGAAHTGRYRNGGKRAVHRAGAALHAGVPVLDGSLSVNKLKYLMRANLGADPASSAFLFVKLQRNHIF